MEKFTTKQIKDEILDITEDIESEIMFLQRGE